jgi:phenylpropionate dioxygenase-like ring-hydroxylating dioxygenase large terminal subunit
MQPAPFLPAWLYSSPSIAEREYQLYVKRCWHPIAASSELGPGEALALELLGLPLLLTRPEDGPARVFLNRCPHRGVALLDKDQPAHPCRRLVCPYHGWTYDLNGQLRAAAREGEFLEPFNRGDWPLQKLRCREEGSLIWVALGDDPLPLEQQLDLVLSEAGSLWRQPRRLLIRQRRPLACNWKLAHDNTLDDYHVAIAHPTTLHREQGPVRAYRHVLSRHGSLLATPSVAEGTFFTFGLVPWTHLLLWPDGRLAVLHLLPELGPAVLDPQAPSRCQMEVWLLGAVPSLATVADPAMAEAEMAESEMAELWMAEMLRFLEEDRRLVEATQRGYSSGLEPGPAHQLEQRILQWQALYAEWMELESLLPKAPPRSQAAIAPLISSRSATG